jgi:hypothetical protein
LEPDYILYPDAETKERVIDKSAAERYRASAAILEAKKVNHPLSKISKHQQRYPHQQIRDYLNEAQVLTWGILTNGNEWRLYCRDDKPSYFFALNFEVALKSIEELLFILYAEGRSLLPVEPKSRKYYKELSVARLISPLKNFSEFDSHTRFRLYQDIQELCHLINGNDEKKRIWAACRKGNAKAPTG